MILARYILREQIGPFFFSLVALTTILLLNQIIKLMRYIVEKGLEAGVVLELFLLSLPFIIVLTVPMAVLVATVLAFGRLSEDTELTAMKAAGIPLYRLMLPSLFAAGILAIGLAFFQNHILPDTNHRIRTLTADIARKKPTFSVQEGVVTELDAQTRMRVDSVDHVTGDLGGVRLLELRKDAPPINFVAPRGRMTMHQGGQLTVDLFDGEILDAQPEDEAELRRTLFRAYTFFFTVHNDFHRTESDYRGDRELSAQDLRDRISDSQVIIDEHMMKMRNERAEADWPADRASSGRWARWTSLIESKTREIHRYEVEIHKKFAIACACLSFVMIGAPLGAIPKRGGNSLGVILCILLFILHYVCLVGGERLADRGIVSPPVAMWSPDVFVTFLGMWLIYMNGYETLFFRLQLPRWIARRLSNSKAAT